MQVDQAVEMVRSIFEGLPVGDPFDPVENLRGGMAYLRWLLRHFTAIADATDAMSSVYSPAVQA